MITYLIITAILLAAELLYFRVADRCNIIDRPNERSSHSSVVLRGGGVIFTIAMWVWLAFFGGEASQAPGMAGDGGVGSYLPFLIGLTLIAGVSFVDDIRSLPDSVRLVAQFVAMGLMFWNLGIMHWEMWWMVLVALFVFVGATNIFNFMDGINGITAGYALAVLVPLLLMNGMPGQAGHDTFVEPNLIVVAILAVVVFAFFNFRPKGKAKCFAGDVGSVGMAFILLFFVGRLMLAKGDFTWLLFVLVYGIDGCCTIAHRILLHEHLGEAHRKHAYQLMANELGMSHVAVSLIYMGLQLAISLVMIYLVPDTALAHWIYLVVVGLLLAGAYVGFMRKFYHLHEEYLKSL